jgi:hypothetical protein
MTALFLTTVLATIASWGSAQAIASYAQPEIGGDAQIRGRITSFDNADKLKVGTKRVTSTTSSFIRTQV